MILKYIVKNNNYDSINQLLKVEYKISSRLLSKLIKDKQILLNGQICDTRIKPQIGDIVILKLEYEEDNSNIEPTEINLDIVFEDEGLLVINKPAGIAIHPSIRHYKDSLSNGVKLYFDKIGLKKKIRPVNRLDLDTSGLVIFAKNEYMQESLIKQMKNEIFLKEYICAVDGTFEEKEGIIDLPIARKEDSIIERCVNNCGQEAITCYEVLEEFDDYSIVKCRLKTGRTHQIRVHFAYLGHPLLGDTLYGRSSNIISRQALHCYRLCFMHPITKKMIDLICELPLDIKKLWMK